jgi:signal transduction histidine kinase
MEERVTLLGGTLTVSSSPGHGTRVAFTIPLKGVAGEGADDTQAEAVAPELVPA